MGGGQSTAGTCCSVAHGVVERALLFWKYPLSCRGSKSLLALGPRWSALCNAIRVLRVGASVPAEKVGCLCLTHVFFLRVHKSPYLYHIAMEYASHSFDRHQTYRE